MARGGAVRGTTTGIGCSHGAWYATAWNNRCTGGIIGLTGAMGGRTRPNARVSIGGTGDNYFGVVHDVSGCTVTRRFGV